MKKLSKSASFLSRGIVGSLCLVGVNAFTLTSAKAQNLNYWGGYSTTVSTDVTKPVPDRSYFKTSVEPVKGGAKLGVDIFHGKLNSPVTLILQVAIDDGKGNVKAIPIKVLSDKVADNSTLYFSHREFELNYKDLNQELNKLLPPGAQHLTIGEGTPMFLMGQFWDFDHQWGGLARGGLFFMPEGTKGHVAPTGVSQRRALDLDLAFTITQPMAMNYNDANTQSGLKVGGQVRSRVEGEGKYQVELSQKDAIKKKLFELNDNPAEAARVLGPDWTIKAELRYMQKDAAGNLVLDSHGLPIPDPMVDTYYDDDSYDAAKNDVAIRYRETEVNGVGAWNIKPDGGEVNKEGIAYRREFGVDATDSKPETIKKFADSMDPMNPFRSIRSLRKGVLPSDFLKPSVVVKDTRYKFLLKHKDGLAIEVSLDEVRTHSIREPHRRARYVQMEMDIDHMSTSSTRAIGAPATTYGFKGVGGELDADRLSFLAGLSQSASLEGRPVMHIADDVKTTSPLQQKYEHDFDLATKVIVNIRKETLGEHWVYAPQKYAFAAETLGLVEAKDASASVVRMKDRRSEVETKLQKPLELHHKIASFGECAGEAFK